ncbi:hypothetical protein Vadar_012926 [Vaccinium darrowii]|uniref:Uncharacterized protein n=1 Tax=Vaccinium darrowii TaxID=229202 RepID=A0ACB7YLT9_9ERIC|nr:hypothetical protein Vadar_012926 [Vaccinium darrowii]
MLLGLASLNGDEAAQGKLLEKMTREDVVNQVNHRGSTALHIAAITGNIEGARMFYDCFIYQLGRHCQPHTIIHQAPHETRRPVLGRHTPGSVRRPEPRRIEGNPPARERGHRERVPGGAKVRGGVLYIRSGGCPRRLEYLHMLGIVYHVRPKRKRRRPPCPRGYGGRFGCGEEGFDQGGSEMSASEELKAKLTMIWSLREGEGVRSRR